MADPVENPALAAESTDRAAVSDQLHSREQPAVVVEFDLICRGCGYNLRGLSPRSRCPECDQPISHAMQGDWLRYSEPRWVATIARGYRLLAGAVAIGVLAIIFAAASARSLAMPWLTLAIALTVGIVSLVGVDDHRARARRRRNRTLV